MKVRAIIPFLDLRENVDREVGDEWEVTEERYAEIVLVNASLIEKVAEKKAAPSKRKTKKEPAE